MKRNEIIYTICCVIVAFGLLFSVHKIMEYEKEKRTGVLIISDSLFADRSLEKYLEKKLDVKVDTMAFKGYGAKDIYNEVFSATNIKYYNQVIILAGVNSIRYVTSTQGYMQSIYHYLKGKGKIITAVTLPPWKGYETASPVALKNTRVFNMWLGREAKDVDYVIDSYILLESQINREFLYKEFRYDNLHFNSKGSERIGREILRQWK